MSSASASAASAAEVRLSEALGKPNPFHNKDSSEDVTHAQSKTPLPEGSAPSAAASLPFAAKLGLGAFVTAIFIGFFYVASTTISDTHGSTSRLADPALRTFALSVEEVRWSYGGASGTREDSGDACFGTSLDDSEAANTFLGRDPEAGLVGPTYYRRQWVAYTDESFSSTDPSHDPAISKEAEHLAALGPMLRANVGDTLRVRVRNRSRYPASFHIHGIPLHSLNIIGPASTTTSSSSSSSLPGVLLARVRPAAPGASSASSSAANAAPSVVDTALYDPFSGGYRIALCVPSSDKAHLARSGTACSDFEDSPSASVQPGETAEYEFVVPPEAGPDPSTSSAARLYQSLEYGAHDVGLTGLLVVQHRPTVRATGNSAAAAPALVRPADVSHEFAAVFSVMNENDSPYLPLNVLEFVMRGRAAERIESGDLTRPAPTVLERLSADERSPVFPLHPNASQPGAILAALYNQAAAAASRNASLLPTGAGSLSAPAGEIGADDPAIVALLAAAPGGAQTPEGPLTAPFVLPPSSRIYGLSLGGVTLFPPQSSPASSLAIVDARGYVARFGQVAAEEALGPLALEGVTSEASHDGDLFEESNLMHAINGKLYCHLNGIEMPQGAASRWYLAVVGTEVDLHAAHTHGNTFLHSHGHRRDSVPLLPRQVTVADMGAHSAGPWLVHCHVTDHIHAGMTAIYTVVPERDAASAPRPMMRVGSGPLAPAPFHVARALGPSLQGGRIRDYFVSAEVEQWDYMDAAGSQLGVEPASTRRCGSLDVAALAETFNGSSSWPKARYVRYTDASFTTKFPSTAESAHAGILGPVLRAEVGDVMRVTFRNRSPAPFSLHPHGVAYNKDSEGAPYADGTVPGSAAAADDTVAPGGSHTYIWLVPDTAGPGPLDTSSIPWIYHSHFHETSDENAGMIGYMIVTGRGKARVPGSVNEADLVPADVDREILLFAKAFDESSASEDVHESDGTHVVSASHNHRLRRELHSHAVTGPPEDATHTIFSGINGRMACSLAHLTATEGQRVRGYFASLGNEIDLHHIGIESHALEFEGRRVGGVSLMPGTMFSADFVAGSPGSYLVSSAVQHHKDEGMSAIMTVEAPSPSSSSSSSSPSRLTGPFLPVGEGAATRRYFIAAEEVVWDYAPAGEDLCIPAEARGPGGPLSSAFEPLLGEDDEEDSAGTHLNSFTADGRIFVGVGLGEAGTSLGKKYKKAVYTGYSDATFTTRTYMPGANSPGPMSQSSLRGTGAAAGSSTSLKNALAGSTAASASTGILGPTLRASVGDVLVVTFRNSLNFSANIHFPAGPVLVAARARAPGSSVWRAISLTDEESAMGTPALAAWAAPPGWMVEYTWRVVPSAGPATLDASTVAWSYTSSVSTSHLFAGLVGPAIVAASPRALVGADREVVIAWYISNENASPYLDDNIAAYAPDPAAVDKADGDFDESNLMHAVSGLLNCGTAVWARAGETVRVHFIGLGSVLDMHTPQVHGIMLHLADGGPARSGGSSSRLSTVALAGSYAAAVPLHPGSTLAADFVAPAVGGPDESVATWLIECGVNDHWKAGMRAALKVVA